MKKSLLVANIVMVLSMSVLAGCSSKPTMGDVMASHATELQDQVELKNKLSKDWQRGDKLVKSGDRKVSDAEKRIKRAERDLERAQRQLADGRKEVTEGAALKANSERLFKQTFPDLTLNK